jgi:predicted ATP-grasp superfamily ATP-dependent carboligase
VAVPRVAEPGFADAVQAELAARPYIAVLAATDATLLALGAPVGHLVNKVELAERAEHVGLPVPPTRVFASGEEMMAADDLEFPAVLKPALSNPFNPARLLESRDDIDTAPLGQGPLLVQPYLRENLRAVAGVLWEGRLVAAAHQRYVRTWPVDCGTACAAFSVEADVELEHCLIRLLDGYEGIFQAQLAGDRLLDLNPRVYGSLPLAVAAGANLPAIYCELLSGKEVRSVRGGPGIFYRWLEGDVRHIASSVRDGRIGFFSALRSLRPHRKTVHSTESLRDPMPMVARLRHAATKRLR